MPTVILSGIFVGLIYGLLAVGLVITYRTSRVVNFAHGETGMLAAFAYFDLRFGSNTTTISADHGILLALPVAVVLGAMIGLAMEWAIARPLRSNPTLNGMVGTIGASLLFITFAVRRWGTQVRPIHPLLNGDGVKLLGLRVSPSQLMVGACTLAILGALAALYRFSSLGLRFRATALNPYGAALSGINTNSTSMVTWAMAGALSAVSGILIAPLVAPNVFFMTLLGLRAFAAALVGGLTSIWGGLLAGVLLGILESVIAFESPVAGITDVIVALGIIALVVARPGGLVRAEY
ncbi:MAG: branched-chain amino acid ABC transporter permease [Acidimicrobiales bacterium]